MASITTRKQAPKGAEALQSNPIMGWIIENKSVLSLAILSICSAFIYGFVFIPTANLLELYQRPLLNLYTLPRGGTSGLFRVIMAFLVLGLVYWQGWRIARHLRGKIAWSVVLVGSLASGILLLFVYPFDAADVFDNILRGRILGIYGGNPFLPNTSPYANDPFYKYIAWRGWPSAYGPGWEATAGFIARLAGNGVIANVLAFKMLPGAFLLASLGLVALILRKEAPQHALAGTLLLAWNPIVLYETWGNGHNDVAMVFWILVAALALLNHRYTAAILALVAGALFKFIPILLIPPAIVLALRNLRFPRRRAGFLAITTLLSVLLFVFAYAPFWNGAKVLNIQRRTQLYTSSLPSMIYYLLLDQHWTKTQAAAIISQAALVLVVLFVFLKTRRVWKNPGFNEYAEIAVQILMFYLLVACLWFQNWYSLWPAGLAPLLGPGRSRRLALLLGFATLSKPLGIGPLLYWPKPKMAQPWLEICFTLGIFALPWIYWLLSTWKTKHDRSTS